MAKKKRPIPSKSSHSLNKETVITVILTLTALGLGAVLFKQYSLDQYLKFPQIKSDQSSAQQSITPTVLPKVQDSSTFSLETVKFPAPNESDQKRQKFADTISAQSKPTDTIKIKNCMADPVVSRLKPDQKLTIQNNDDVDRFINITPQDQLSVGANSSSELTARFENGEGIYGFSCGDNQPGLAGIIFVTTRP